MNQKCLMRESCHWTLSTASVSNTSHFMLWCESNVLIRLFVFRIIHVSLGFRIAVKTYYLKFIVNSKSLATQFIKSAPNRIKNWVNEMQIAIWLQLAIHGAILLSASNASVDNDGYNGKNIGRTSIDSNGERFLKILRRKKRFLLFPPGSALVVSFSNKWLKLTSLWYYNIIIRSLYRPLCHLPKHWYRNHHPE